MIVKQILAALAAAVVGFFLGWLIFGVLLLGFYEANMTVYEGLMKEEHSMWGYIVGNLAWGVLFVYVFAWLAAVKTFWKGFVAGLIMTFLIMLCFDLYIFTGMNLFTFSALLVDLLVNTVLGGLMAGVAALILGVEKKKAE